MRWVAGVTPGVTLGAHTGPSDWPPVLVAFVLLVVVGGAVVAFNFFRQARGATRRHRRR